MDEIPVGALKSLHRLKAPEDLKVIILEIKKSGVRNRGVDTIT